MSSSIPNIQELIRRLQWSAFFNFQSNQHKKRLQPIAIYISSYILDISHFKSLLNDLHIDHSNIPFTLDLESLSSNIPIQQGIASFKKALLEHPSKGRPDKYLLPPISLPWKWYIDDIFGIWQHSETQLHNFLQHLNSISPKIKVILTSFFKHQLS